MCGRYVASSPTAVLADVFDVDETLMEEPAPNFNVAPTDPVPAVAVNRAGQRTLGQLRWGLVPSWSPDTKGAARMINARLETVQTSRAFQRAFERRRCLVPADGFYEWERRADGSKLPWFVHQADGQVMAMAGIWEVWRPADADPETVPLLRTCAVLTTTAETVMAPIHDRQPVILPAQLWDDWLDKETDLAEVAAIAQARVELARHPVASTVNSVKNNGPELVAPVPQPDAAPVALKLL